MNENFFKTALTHHKNGNWNKAREIYEHLLKSNPNNYAVLLNYGPLLSQLNENKLAKNVFEKCLKIYPKDPLLLYNYGKFFHNRKVFDKAIEFYEKSFEIQPQNNLSMYNIGNIYSEKKEFKKSIKYFEKTIDKNPSNFFAYNNIGFSYKQLGNYEKAESFFKKSIEKKSDFIEGHINYSTTLLSQKKFDQGFSEYEFRKKSKIFPDYINYRELKIETPIWEGQNISGKTILIFTEQGIGDIFQFSRYIYELHNVLKARVILRLKHNLFHFYNLKGIRTISENEKIPKHDFHQHLMSLPGIFYKKNKSFLKNINFINYDNLKLKKWQDFFKSFSGVKVGINSETTLRPGATGSLERYIPIEQFKVLTDIKNINFFVIEREFNEDKLKVINKNSNVNYFKNLDKSVKPFEDTVGIIKNLDLVITADTSIAHLSVTLQKKTWIALPFVCDWRWFREQKESVWYDDVLLYRQKDDKSWNKPFLELKKDLEKKFKH